LTTVDNWPGGNGAVTPVEQLMLGGVLSTTVTLNEQLGPPMVVQETVVVPTANTDPEGGAHVTVPQPSDEGE
jgi:hypothetical protein